MTETILQTERIELRLINESDLNAIHNLLSLPETDKFNALGIPESLEETAVIVAPWIEDNNATKIINYTFAIEDISNQTFVGLIGMKQGRAIYKRGEVWYKILPSYWGKGYATEALREIINFSFSTLKLHRIQAGCAVENLASIKVLEKVGMIKEGTQRQNLPLKTGWSDNYEYAILDSDDAK